ncbi:MAG TPA: proline-specific permease ProY, partial [Arthrobacter sp.]
MQHAATRQDTEASPTERPGPGTAVASVLNRGLNVRHIRFMALGSAIGTGL